MNDDSICDFCTLPMTGDEGGDCASCGLHLCENYLSDPSNHDCDGDTD